MFSGICNSWSEHCFVCVSSDEILCSKSYLLNWITCAVCYPNRLFLLFDCVQCKALCLWHEQPSTAKSKSMSSLQPWVMRGFCKRTTWYCIIPFCSTTNAKCVVFVSFFTSANVRHLAFLPIINCSSLQHGWGVHSCIQTFILYFGLNVRGQQKCWIWHQGLLKHVFLVLVFCV